MVMSQEIKKVKNQTIYDYEEYFVAKADKNIKEGKYFKLTQHKEDSLVSGTYLKNERSGHWRFYERGVLIGEGDYREGKKQGVWHYFENGQLTLKYDHTLDSVLVRGSNEVPQYPGFSHLIYENILYPVQALRMGIMGKVEISFVVSENGEIGNFKIEKDIGSGCGSELLRVLMLLNNDWLPGEVNGRKVPVKVLVSGDFKLLDNGDKTIVVRKI